MYAAAITSGREVQHALPGPAQLRPLRVRISTNPVLVAVPRDHLRAAKIVYLHAAHTHTFAWQMQKMFGAKNT